MSSLCIEVLPSRLIPTILYAAITYWMAGLAKNIISFFMWFAMLVNVSISSGTLLLFLSVVVPDLRTLQIFFALEGILSIMTCGFLMNLKSLTWAIKWFKYLSVPRYCIESMTISELLGLQEIGKTCNLDEKMALTQEVLDIPVVSYS